jgi:hypothetical protein
MHQLTSNHPNVLEDHFDWFQEELKRRQINQELEQKAEEQ